MVNVMHARPRYDFSADYFVKIYRAECVNLRLHCNLIKSVLDKQVCTSVMCKIIKEIIKLSSVLSVPALHNLLPMKQVFNTFTLDDHIVTIRTTLTGELKNKLSLLIVFH